jgi:hypothetical protein
MPTSKNPRDHVAGGEAESDATPEELTKEFHDDETADKAKVEEEKADPEDQRNTP